MNRIAIGGLSAVVLMSAASAACAAPATFNWTGFYVGAHAGGGWAREDWDQTSGSLSLPLDRDLNQAKLDSFIGGGQVGYLQQSGNWVFGVEGKLSGGNQEDHVGHVVFTSYGQTSKIDWNGSLTGRVGVTTGNALIYAKGGVGWAHEKAFITFGGVQTTNEHSSTRTGWTLGGGVEIPLAPRWTANAEYMYADYGTQNQVYTYTANPAGLVENWDVKTRQHTATIGVNYHF